MPVLAWPPAPVQTHRRQMMAGSSPATAQGTAHVWTGQAVTGRSATSPMRSQLMAPTARAVPTTVYTPAMSRPGQPGSNMLRGMENKPPVYPASTNTQMGMVFEPDPRPRRLGVPQSPNLSASFRSTTRVPTSMTASSPSRTFRSPSPVASPARVQDALSASMKTHQPMQTFRSANPAPSSASVQDALSASVKTQPIQNLSALMKAQSEQLQVPTPARADVQWSSPAISSARAAMTSYRTGSARPGVRPAVPTARGNPLGASVRRIRLGDSSSPKPGNGSARKEQSSASPAAVSSDSTSPYTAPHELQVKDAFHVPLATAPVLSTEIAPAADPAPAEPAMPSSLPAEPAPPVLSGILFEWELQPDQHPMEADGERLFIEECLKTLHDLLGQHGGLMGYATSLKHLQRLASKVHEGEANALLLLARSLEDILQQKARVGGDSIFVEQGWMMSMGNKKVVKIAVQCIDECEGAISVCWDWDKKLESGS